MLQLYKVTTSLLISNARAACNEELLTREGVTFCVNVTRQQPFPGLQQVRGIRVPVFDDPAEDLYRYFEQCSDAIEEAVQRGGKCLVYCKNGRSRSAAVCTAYLMKHRKLPLKDAFETVKTARPVAEPNAGFWSQLQRYEEDLQMPKQPDYSTGDNKHPVPLCPVSPSLSCRPRWAWGPAWSLGCLCSAQCCPRTGVWRCWGAGASGGLRGAGQPPQPPHVPGTSLGRGRGTCSRHGRNT
ncbi:Dusp28 [Columba livia]|nr:dual specificity phosphatase 28 isoform X1 [Columba livia]KAK2538610.1 Dusp28 [Columba livia]